MTRRSTAAVTFVLRSILARKGSWIVWATTSLIAVVIVALLVIGIIHAPETARAVGGRVAVLLGL